MFFQLTIWDQLQTRIGIVMSTHTLPSRAWSCDTMKAGADACQVVAALNLKGSDLPNALKDPLSKTILRGFEFKLEECMVTMHTVTHKGFWGARGLAGRQQASCRVESQESRCFSPIFGYACESQDRTRNRTCHLIALLNFRLDEGLALDNVREFVFAMKSTFLSCVC